MKTRIGKVSEHRVMNKKRRDREDRALSKVKRVKPREIVETESSVNRELRIRKQAKHLGIHAPNKEDYRLEGEQPLEEIYLRIKEFCKTSKKHTAV